MPIFYRDGKFSKTARDEFCKKMSIMQSGKKNSMFGKKHKQETLREMSRIQKELGINLGREPWNKNGRMSDEACSKMSQSHTGIRQTREHIDKRTENIKKPVMARGRRYRSMSDAARALGVSVQTIRNRIDSDKAKFAGYRLLTEKHH